MQCKEYIYASIRSVDLSSYAPEEIIKFIRKKFIKFRQVAF